VKRFKPLTPGLRFKVANTFAELTTDKPEKSLLAPLSKSGGPKQGWQNDHALYGRWP
ncbi:MAG: hypothetical protein RIT39_554, partial [Bacteroidota bacterium]